MRYLFSILIGAICCSATAQNGNGKFFAANNPQINYVGRIDFTDPLKPRFWAPGVYLQARFKGTSLAVDINDEVLYGKNHNYIEVAIDNETPKRLQTTGKNNHIILAGNLSSGNHIVTICKDTESGIGYLEFVGFTCTRLLPWVNVARHKIEFIGNSITCGTGSDLSKVPCDKGEWYDKHNAYLSYGPTTARQLNSEWHLTAVSGIGLMHSCCGLPLVMPQVFDKVNLRDNAIAWDFKKYIPDVVTICLGQNDGVQDSVIFCKNYISFLQTIRQQYPHADIICLTSPMADDQLLPVMKRYLSGINAAMHQAGDQKIHQYFYSRRYHNGCDTHPDLAEHQLIAQELSKYIKQLKGW